MSISLYHEIIIDNKFKNFLKNKKYEESIFELLLDQNHIFPNKPFIKVKEQSNKEPDYLDSKGNKYDVKLLINSKQGAHLGRNDGSFELWLHDMKEETNEFNPLIIRENTNYVKELILYKTMNIIIDKLEDDEIGLLYMPFNIVIDSKDSLVLSRCGNFLLYVYDALKQEFNYKKSIYFIYPSIDEDYYVIVNANNIMDKEYVKTNAFKKYINYKTKYIKTGDENYEH